MDVVVHVVWGLMMWGLMVPALQWVDVPAVEENRLGFTGGQVVAEKTAISRIFVFDKILEKTTRGHWI